MTEHGSDRNGEEQPPADAQQPSTQGGADGALGNIAQESEEPDPPAARLPRVGRARVAVAALTDVSAAAPANEPDGDGERAERVAESGKSRRDEGIRRVPAARQRDHRSVRLDEVHEADKTPFGRPRRSRRAEAGYAAGGRAGS